MLELYRHIPTREQLIQLLEDALKGHSQAKQQLDLASEIIVYGSVACGLHGPNSDIDVLAVGTGERLRTKVLDLKFVETGSLSGRLWLGGELAGHVAAHGVWLHGEPAWLSMVSSSLWSKRKKTGRILNRLCDVYARRTVLSSEQMARFLERALLDILRLERMSQERPIPSTSELMYLAVLDCFRVIERVPELIGEAPIVMLKEILSCDILEVSGVLRESFEETWKQKLRRDHAWRNQALSGVPAISVVP